MTAWDGSQGHSGGGYRDMQGVDLWPFVSSPCHSGHTFVRPSGLGTVTQVTIIGGVREGLCCPQQAVKQVSELGQTPKVDTT